MQINNQLDGGQGFANGAAAAAVAGHDADAGAHSELFAAVGSPRIFYVDSIGGSDSNAGTTSADPFKTLTKASTVAANGVEFRLKCGSVFADALSASAFSNVSILPYGGGNRPILSGGSLLTFTKTAGRTYVYQSSVTLDTSSNPVQVADLSAAGATPRMLRVVASAALCDSTPGSVYYSAGVVYVHKSDNAAPNSDVSVATVGNLIHLGNRGSVRGLAFKNGFGTSLYLAGLDSECVDCRFEQCGKHHLVIGSGSVRECSFIDSMHYGDIPSGFSSLAFYFSDATNPQKTIEVSDSVFEYGLGADRVTYAWQTATNEAPFVAHNGVAGTGGFTDARVAGCRFTNFATCSLNPSASLTIEDNLFLDVVTVFYGAIPRLFCERNTHVQTARKTDQKLLPYQFTGATIARFSECVFSCNTDYSQGVIWVNGDNVSVSLSHSDFAILNNRGKTGLLVKSTATGISIYTTANTFVGATDLIAFALNATTTYAGTANRYSPGTAFSMDSGSTRLSLEAFAAATSEMMSLNEYRFTSPQSASITTPASTPAGGHFTATITVAGAVTGSRLLLGSGTTSDEVGNGGWAIAGCAVSAADTVKVTLVNVSGITLGTSTLRVVVQSVA